MKKYKINVQSFGLFFFAATHKKMRMFIAYLSQFHDFLFSADSAW